MLTLLKIRNLALVDELVWELGPGLVGVTGETGAGKSVIVGALKLVLGERAEKSLIRTGEDTCTVEAVFDLRDASEINALLIEGGLDACEDGLLIGVVAPALGGFRIVERGKRELGVHHDLVLLSMNHARIRSV